MLSNLPPGVTTSMLPGNTSDDAAWEKFMEFADEQLTMSDLCIEEAYMAVRAGIAAVKATRDDVHEAISAAREDERMAYDMEKSAEG